jgi:type VI secretion system protein ImpJ
VRAVSANEVPDAIQWHEGMLLTPQHFQQQAARLEGLLQYSSTLMAPFCWGVRKLTIDPDLLPGGVFRVLNLEATMPDGLVVSHDASAGDDLRLDLMASSKASGSRLLTVHLAVPVRTATPMKGDFARYRSLEGEPIADENTGDGALRIPRLRPRLVLLATETPPAKYNSFPLAVVERQDEVFELTGFIPPTTAVSADSPLGDLCSTVANRLREKAIFLSERVRAPSAAAGAPVILEGQRQIHSLVGALPPFEAILATGRSHPYTLYLSLCAVAGHVAALAGSLLPPIFTAYNHNDLRSAFGEVRDFILRAVNEGISEAYTRILFKFRDGGFNLMFDSAWADRRLVIGIRGQSGTTEKEMMAWGRDCLIGSEDVIPSLHQKRILGAARQFLDRDDELIPTAGVVLFVLQRDLEFIKPNRVLRILNTRDVAGSAGPAEIVLYVRNTAG